MPVYSRAVGPRVDRNQLRGMVSDGFRAMDAGKMIAGKTVLIKPNFCGPASCPPLYSKTDPELIIEVARTAYQLGAGKVVCADNPAGYVKDSAAFFKALQIENRLSEDDITFRDLRTLPFRSIDGYKLSSILQSERPGLIINLTLPKTHHQATLSLSLKNLAMGLLAHEERQAFHNSGSLHQAIVRVNNLLARNTRILHIIDGRRGQEGNGPHFGDPIDLGFMLIGTDPVAVDTLAARAMGFDPSSIETIRVAAQARLGQIEPGIEGDVLPTFKMRPSPAWEFATLPDGRTAVFWISNDGMKGHCNYYSLNPDRLTYSFIKGLEATFTEPVTKEKADNWFFFEGGIAEFL
jgi:uncharacterized protein (DUF362 family)